eukprot:COSAG06_NODE_764_length_12486_cov_190.016630_13_plen_49_part_00
MKSDHCQEKLGTNSKGKLTKEAFLFQVWAQQQQNCWKRWSRRGCIDSW